jgi:DNA repair exonuclease SbcCD ATPase subunit
MIILEYSLKNAGRIKAVQVKPKPAGVTSIGGRNRQGKTTNLDMLCWALGGDKYKPDEPNHRNGDGPAELDVLCDNGIRVQRKGKNGTLKVTDEKNGTSGNQTLLDKFVTTFALDIRQFRTAKGKDKLDILLKTLGVDVQYAECQAHIDEAYESRTVVNRIAKQKEGAFKQAPKPGELPCDEPINVDSLVGELQKANAANAERQRKLHHKEVLSTTIANREAEIARLEKMLAGLREAVELDKNELAAYPEIPAETSTLQLQADIAQANAINTEYAKVRQARDNYDRMAKDLRQAQKAATDADAAVEQARRAKLDLLASCQMPDPDIGVNEEGELTYQGDTWEQLADSDELILCCKIVSRLNPECRFVLVDGLEKLDDDTLAALDTWAEEQKLQIIGTRVTTDAAKASLIIEDGEVAYAEDEVRVA